MELVYVPASECSRSLHLLKVPVFGLLRVEYKFILDRGSFARVIDCRLEKSGMKGFGIAEIP
jgi:hypothetical protein